MKKLSPVGLPTLAVASGATSPNPGYPAIVWSSVTNGLLWWNGTQWAGASGGGSVSGPVSSTTNAVAIFSDTSGTSLSSSPLSYDTSYGKALALTGTGATPVGYDLYHDAGCNAYLYASSSGAVLGMDRGADHAYLGNNTTRGYVDIVRGTSYYYLNIESAAIGDALSFNSGATARWSTLNSSEASGTWRYAGGVTDKSTATSVAIATRSSHDCYFQNSVSNYTSSHFYASNLGAGIDWYNATEFRFNYSGTMVFSVGSAGQLKLGAAGSAGTSGQVLTSQGAGAAPVWATPAGSSNPAWYGSVYGAFSDCNPQKLIDFVAIAGVGSPTPTNISATKARCCFFTPPADITVANLRWVGAGATTNVYRIAIYSCPVGTSTTTWIRVTSEIVVSTSSGVSFNSASAGNVVLTAGVRYAIAVSVNANGTTPGILAFGSTTALTTGGFVGVNFPASLAAYQPFWELAVTAGALPASVGANYNITAAWTGGMPAIWLDAA